MLAHPLFAGFGRLHRLESRPVSIKALMLSLTVSERLDLKGRAHQLKPTVIIGNAGLTEAVFNEIAQTLKIHELIKIRVMAERPQREEMLNAICTRLNAAPVQHIGKILVVYLPNPEANKIEIKKMPRHKGKPLSKKQLGSR
ncbi:MAG: YhbY family RNA-binding protein [Gallionellaceae bacterium]|nr:YhbY family RNA-binding protein [Gallionellaceae bacterium]